MWAAVEESARVYDLSPFTVVGGREQLSFTPGTGYTINMAEVSVQGWDNIDQILRRVPGVYFRTEDGYGLFPNISLRGVGSMRTTQVTVMEDGVLSAPAPYAAPAAYYTPASGRMSAVEVLKGSSQVRFGPQTSGGILNYVSTPIPQERSGKVSTVLGENSDWRVHMWLGERFATDAGTLGLLVEVSHRSTNGYKSIDPAPGYEVGDTGFKRTEPMLKLSWTPGSGPEQYFELKIGYTDLEANETYLGLSDADFEAEPFRRYTASRFDMIPTTHLRSYLRHWIALGNDTRWSTTLYMNDFERAWYKLQDVRDGNGGSASLAAALAGSPFYAGGREVAGSAGLPLAVLRGEAAGVWRVRDNNRAYRSYGLEQLVEHRLETDSVTHDLELGLRLHRDYEDRRQKDDDYRVDATGNVTGTTIRPRGTQDNRRGTAEAVAVFVRDHISFERLTLVSGVRYEHVRYTNERRGTTFGTPDFDRVLTTNRASLDVWAPGIGFTYDLKPGWILFGGVHGGFSLPSPSAATSPSNPIDPERSVGYELGVRHMQNGWLRTEAALFWTDFDDLIVPDNIGGAGTTRTENAGAVRSRGLELSVMADPGTRLCWGFRNPYTLSYTYTDATLRSDVNAGGASGGAVESIFAGGKYGNRLPYIPKHQLSIGTGLEWQAFGINIDLFYTTATWAAANNAPEALNPTAGPGGTPAPDARFGRNSAYFLADVAVWYRPLPGLRVSVGAQNVLDREYGASRLPHGVRPGHPRFLYAGLDWEF